ncbi:uncharacterized protein BYT42DRAFT_352527 [Radiomyces spectabilis]|uniref:uncharacterized protein n=1 Tax=Radiomyces spectabilis TaxID=64574 RepID=UPI00221EF335|nr:uncharacterized protein BYT42DRAFT_352527 [Radiomyces spectabilis]KAI8377673.1 hypothetical protein BYT42DRAFT_352527 [Radiomyces spectabilis]
MGVSSAICIRTLNLPLARFFLSRPYFSHFVRHYNTVYTTVSSMASTLDYNTISDAILHCAATNSSPLEIDAFLKRENITMSHAKEFLSTDVDDSVPPEEHLAMLKSLSTDPPKHESNSALHAASRGMVQKYLDDIDNMDQLQSQVTQAIEKTEQSQSLLETAVQSAQTEL